MDEDLISKKAVRAKAIELFGCIPLINEGHRREMTIDEFLKDVPTVEAEPVRYGHWIDITPVMSSGKAFKCSKCGRTVVLGMSRSNLDVVEEYPYCHCGAKMRKEDE